jgi:hypothetical protein
MFVLYNSRLSVIGMWVVRTSEVVVLSTLNIESLYFVQLINVYIYEYTCSRSF